MLRWARAYEIDLRIVPSLYEGLTWNRAMEYVGQFPTFSLHRAKIPEFSLFIKHTMDFVLAALFLAIGAVPMLVIAVLIKLDSKGPVFYRSERVGRKGAHFQMHQVPHHDSGRRSQVGRVDAFERTKWRVLQALQ